VAKTRLTDHQAGILISLEELHNDGISRFGRPLGITALTLGGAGPGGAGLLKRGLMRESESGGLYYITDKGIETLKQWSEAPVPMRTF